MEHLEHHTDTFLWGESDNLRSRSQMRHHLATICDKAASLLQCSASGSLLVPIDELRTVVKERFEGRVIWDYEPGHTIAYRDRPGLFWQTPTGFIECSYGSKRLGRNASMIVASTDPKVYEDLREWLKTIVGKAEEGTVFILQRTRQGLSTAALGRIAEPLVRENYDAGTLASYDEALEQLTSRSPSGRLVLMSGPSGTGKTYLIRSIANVLDAFFVLLPPDVFGQMTSPSFLPALQNMRENEDDGGEAAHRSIILLVEDADACLAERRSDNIHAITTVLNLGDGLVGQALDVRMVMTTNAPRVEMDDALLRPGRLAAHVRTTFLNRDQAAGVFRRLTTPTAPIPWNHSTQVTLAEAYEAARRFGRDDRACAAVTKRVAGFAP